MELAPQAKFWWRKHCATRTNCALKSIFRKWYLRKISYPFINLSWTVYSGIHIKHFWMLTLSCEKGKKVENKNCEHFLDYFFTSGMLQNVAYSITTLEVGVSPSKQDFFLLQWKLFKNAFYFVLKALFILKVFKFLSWFFGHVEKTTWLERKVNFKIYYVTSWLTKNCNTHVAQYFTK